MTRQVLVNLSDTIETFRQKVNSLSNYIGEPDSLTTTSTTDLVEAINSIKSTSGSTFVRNQISLVATNGASHATLTYDSSTGVFNFNSSTISLSDIPNLSASKITTGQFGVARIPNLDASKITTGVFPSSLLPDSAFSPYISSTSDVAEGSNLYYTDARARAALSSTNSYITYNSGNGEITFVGLSDSDIIGTFASGTGVTISAGGDISIGQAVATSSNVSFADITATGSISGNTAEGDWVASQAEAEAGTNNTHVMTPLRTKQAIESIAPESVITFYESGFSVSTLVNAGGYTYTHGLGGIPDNVTLELKCVTTDGGYVTDDIIEIASWGSSPGMSVLKTSTQIIIRNGSGGPGGYPNKINGNGFNINSTRWVLNVKAIRLQNR
jgi:hypothetical protein